MFCASCWSATILNGLFPNNMDFVLVGMAHQKAPIDTASYVILNEKMIYHILTSGSPDRMIKKFTNMHR